MGEHKLDDTYLEEEQVNVPLFATIDEYLALEEKALEKSEYIRGFIYAMAGASEPHNLICANVIREVSLALKGKNCRVYSSDMKVRIDSANSFVYPDVPVVCGERAFYEGRTDTITNPILLIEVLSPSTERRDRGEKFLFYKSLSSFKEYVLISQDKVYVEVFFKQVEDFWHYKTYSDINQEVVFQSIDVRIPLAEIYDNIVWTNK